MIAKKFWKRIIPLALAVACMLAVRIPVSAAEIDLDRTGSISVQIRAYATEEAVGGGSLNLYHIAGITFSETEGYRYCYTDDFSGCSEDLLTADELEKAETVTVFSEWAASHEVQATETAEVSSEGSAGFADLACGLYMITQDEAAEGYNAINAFLVSIPLEEDGTLIYDVDATPKTSPVKKTDMEEPKKEEPEPEIIPPGTQNPDGNGGNTGGKAGGVKTGDDSWYLILAIAFMSAAVVLVMVRRRYDSRHAQ